MTPDPKGSTGGTELFGSAALRVLHIVAPARVGGLERVVVALASGQRERGHDVTVAAIVAPGEAQGHPFVAALVARQVPAEPIEVSGRAYLRERSLVRRLCVRLRPQVVHTHGYRPDVLHSPVARRGGSATVSTVHGFTAGDWKNRLFEYLDRRALRRFDAVVAVAGPQVAQLRAAGVPAECVVQLPNAWAPDVPPLDRAAARRSLGVPANGFVAGWVGRLTGEKGADVLLEALARLRTPEWHAVVLGDGPDRAALAARAAALGVATRVQWAGVVPDAGRLYRAFDVFVLSSRTEGIPIVLFEAMSADIPIVATRVGGVPEVIGDAAGLLVPGDDPSALAAAIDRVFADAAGAASRARAARATLEQRFALGPWLARYDDVYRQAMRRAAAR